MLYTRNLIAIAVSTAFLLTFSTATVFAADAAKESGQAAGQSGDHHGHQCAHKMSSADQNKDGKISKEEFMKHHEAMFDKKDTNKDGFLDDTEMHGMKDHAHKHDHQKDGGHTNDDAKK
ncbi:MAG: EF-hand domain-containing protein [Nitrosomonas sp.]|nr:EF-hand domain-containing protein [Nitrosomonas sp.]MBP6076157.1 EF-hand domain-containing protein [Nitrosomonas sp.]